MQNTEVGRLQCSPFRLLYIGRWRGLGIVGGRSTEENLVRLRSRGRAASVEIKGEASGSVYSLSREWGWRGRRVRSPEMQFVLSP